MTTGEFPGALRNFCMPSLSQMSLGKEMMLTLPAASAVTTRSDGKVMGTMKASAEPSTSAVGNCPQLVCRPL